ncbi:hypothetical protein CCACVL1_03583 [Corchorus capsularis]|uniref:Uncharacterized protein n=1 Tax=Corchorus capsularis TaxID=210143 RepID=A0A1R3JYA9_COCAP|nr:hypothetical protein CCACVL1_03583 [Corchorus capsularis]
MAKAQISNITLVRLQDRRSISMYYSLMSATVCDAWLLANVD